MESVSIYYGRTALSIISNYSASLVDNVRQHKLSVYH